MLKAAFQSGEENAVSGKDEARLQIIHENKFFFLRKISPELTSAANPPLCAEEAWP